MVGNPQRVPQLVRETSSITCLPTTEWQARQQSSALREVVRITEEMVDIAGEGEWERLFLLQKERDEKLRLSLLENTSDSSVHRISVEIRKLLDLNEGLIAQVEGAREELVNERHRSRAHYRAATSYLT